MGRSMLQLPRLITQLLRRLLNLKFIVVTSTAYISNFDVKWYVKSFLST